MSAIDQKGQQVGVQVNIANLGVSSGAKPLHRPRRAAHFTGREEELARLLDALAPGRAVTVHAPGGMGKTALVAELVARYAPGEEPPEAFPDGVVFYSFYGQPEADRALEFIARAFGLEPKPSADDAARLALSGARAMVVLDGAEEAGDLGRVLACAGDGCCVVVTTRRRADAPDDAHCHELHPLPEHDAVALLREWSAAQVDDQAAAERIVALVGRLPLAVRLVGRYLAQTGESATAYLHWLETTPLEALAPGEGALHREDSVPHLLERSLGQVSESARQILSVVGRVALADFDASMPVEVLEYDEGERRRAYRELAGYGLLLRADERYAVSHALIHTYARERLAVMPARMARLIAHYEAVVLRESAEGAEGHARLAAEHPHLMHLIGDGVSRKEWETVQRLVRAAAGYLDLSGRWADQEVALDAGVTAARARADRGAEGAFLDRLGNAYTELGQVERAIEHYEQALVIQREIGDRGGEGSVLGDLGNAYTELGQVECAIEHHEQALVIARAMGDRRGEGATLGNLGLAYAELGQVERAIEHYDKALVIHREIGDRRGEGTVLGSLGSAYAKIGEVAQARACWEQALVIFKDINSPDVERVTRWLAGLDS